MKRCFDPVVDATTRVLILGSLPGDASLAANEYYAHPRNAFWRLLGDVLDEPLMALPYPQRLARLLERGVGLWDVIASADRQGSLDTALRDPQQNDLPALVAGLPALRAIAFNGATAARHGQRVLGPQRVGAPARVCLPSSSPAHAAKSYPAKLAEWRCLAGFLSSS